jgi:outer membrane biosynthesis protein TonB
MVMPESIKVQFTVMPDGSVNNPLITASTNRRMNSYVLTAVGQWRYAPIVEARLQEVEFAFKPE